MIVSLTTIRTEDQHVEAKELICTAHGYELRRGILVGGGLQVDENKGGGRWTTEIAQLIKYILKKEHKTMRTW